MLKMPKAREGGEERSWNVTNRGPVPPPEQDRKKRYERIDHDDQRAGRGNVVHHFDDYEGVTGQKQDFNAA